MCLNIQLCYKRCLKLQLEKCKESVAAEWLTGYNPVTRADPSHLWSWKFGVLVPLLINCPSISPSRFVKNVYTSGSGGSLGERQDFILDRSTASHTFWVSSQLLGLCEESGASIAKKHGTEVAVTVLCLPSLGLALKIKVKKEEKMLKT